MVNTIINVINHLYLIPYINNIVKQIIKYNITLPVSGSKKVNKAGIIVNNRHFSIIYISFFIILSFFSFSLVF